MKTLNAPVKAFAALLLALILLGNALLVLAEETEIQAQYEVQKSEIEQRLSAIEKEKDHPCVYVTTLDGQAVLSKEEYVPAMIDVLNCPEEYRLTAPGGIRVRGNSTAEQGDEKPYRIKFEQKQNLLGLHDGEKYKSWVLLRSYWNLAPDYMAFHLAKAIFAGQYYSSDSIYVNLYLNGQYQGIYVLCEQNQAAKGRIDVYEPKKGEEQTQIGYLVEMDNYASDEHPYFTIEEMPEVTDIVGTARVIPARNYSIKSDVRSEAQAEYIRRYLTGAFTILYEAAVNERPMMLDDDLQVVPSDGTYETAFDAAAAVMNLDSLANMVILEELVQNYDVGAGSFFMAVDFSENSIYPRITFLGPWDFNWAYYENPEVNYYASTFQKIMKDVDRSNAWYILAMKMEGFRQIVKDKWRELDENHVLTDAVAQVLSDCEALAHDLGPQDMRRVQKAKSIGDFVRKRIQWLNSQWQ